MIMPTYPFMKNLKFRRIVYKFLLVYKKLRSNYLMKASIVNNNPLSPFIERMFLDIMTNFGAVGFRSCATMIL